jgi:uncharacterized membrane protein
MFFAATGGTKTDWQLTWVSGLDTAVLIVLGVLAVVAFAYSVRSLDPAIPLKTRIALISMRALIIAVCFAFLVQPTLHIRTLKSKPSTVAVLVDTSMSMRRGKTTRLSMAFGLLKKTLADIKKYRKDVSVQVFGFSGGLFPAESIDTLLDARTSGVKTDIQEAIKELIALNGQSPPQGIVIISDGADTEIVTGENGERQLGWASRLGIPINAAAVKDAPTRTDLSILQVEAPSIAFLRSDLSIGVTVGAVGIPDREIEAFLKRDGAVLQRRTARLVGGKARLSFNTLPVELGRKVYEIAVPMPEKDEVPDNNRQYFSIEVVRDKYRILHLAGRPSWDQRFLRDTLKSWPRVDLVSFYVLRTSAQSTNDGSAGLSLIPFPTNELFSDHLGEFDVVIFQEFDPSEVGVDAFGEKIADFVKNGGALAVIGGAKGLQSGTFGDKALEEILPVVLLPPGTSLSRLIDQTSFRAKLTAEGQGHPITRLKENDEENKQIWRALHPLDGVGRVARLQQKAQALLIHPGLNADDGPQPLLAVREADKGRTLAVTTDSLWRWRFTGPMNGGPSDHFANFWHKVIAWLTHAPDLDRLRLSITPSEVTLGNAARIEVSLLDEAYRPTPNEKLTVTITWTSADGLEAMDSFESATDEQGRFRKDWMPRENGAHRIRVEGGNGLENASQFFVETNNREQNHLDPEPALLQALADATGGHFEMNALSARELVINPALGEEAPSQTTVSFWNHPIALLVFLILLGVEWRLRRRSGLD